MDMNKIMTDLEKRNVAEGFLSSLKNRDWATLRTMTDEKAVWTLPGKSIISGEASGVEAIIRRAQTIVDFGINFELKHILIGQHGVALSLHNTARRGNLALDEHLATVISLCDGKITAINTYLSDVELVNAFFVSV
jgi:ketosteroid isomerase-like protein